MRSRDAFDVALNEPHRPWPLMRLRSASPGRLAHLAMVVLLVVSATGCAGTRKAALREDFAAAPDVSIPVVTGTPTETPVGPAVEPKQEPIQQQVSPERVEAPVRARVRSG